MGIHERRIQGLLDDLRALERFLGERAWRLALLVEQKDLQIGVAQPVAVLGSQIPALEDRHIKRCTRGRGGH